MHCPGPAAASPSRLALVVQRRWPGRRLSSELFLSSAQGMAFQWSWDTCRRGCDVYFNLNDVHPFQYYGDRQQDLGSCEYWSPTRLGDLGSWRHCLGS